MMFFREILLYMSGHVCFTETKVKALVSVLKAPASKAVTTAIASLGLGSSSEEGTNTSGQDNASHQQDTNAEDTNTSPGDKEVNEPRPASLVTSAGPLPAADSVGIGRSVVLRLAENAAKPSAGDRNRRCSFMLRQAPLLRALQQELISTKGAAPAALDSSMSKLLQVGIRDSKYPYIDINWTSIWHESIGSVSNFVG